MNLLNLKEVTVSELSLALTNNQIENKVDDDGDILLPRKDAISILRIDEDKIKFFGIIEFEPKENIEHLSKFMDKMNYIGESLRFTVMNVNEKNGVKVYYSTALIKHGFIDEEFFSSTINICLHELKRLMILYPSMAEMTYESKGQ